MAYLQPPQADFLSRHGRVVTLGMFIVDHFQVSDDQDNPIPTDEEAIGGGGIFAMTAARHFLPATHCGLLVDTGDDFPDAFRKELKELGEEMIWFRPREGKTTRALNIYSGTKIGEGHQSFQYLSPQKHITPKDLILPPSPFATPFLPEWIHVVCVCERAEVIVQEMERIRREGIDGFGKGWEERMIWEPLGRCCTPEYLEKFIELAPFFAVFSPNLLEMQSILSITPMSPVKANDVIQAATRFRSLLSASGRPVPAIVLRVGELGSYTLSDQWSGWVPAFWREDEQKRVVDVTGGGNAFLGGLLAGLLISDGNMRIASMYAATAASFVIEQRGLPCLSHKDGIDLWNDDDPWTRLQDIAQRVNELERNAK